MHVRRGAQDGRRCDGHGGGHRLERGRRVHELRDAPNEAGARQRQPLSPDSAHEPRFGAGQVRDRAHVEGAQDADRDDGLRRERAAARHGLERPVSDGLQRGEGLLHPRLPRPRGRRAPRRLPSGPDEAAALLQLARQQHPRVGPAHEALPRAARIARGRACRARLLARRRHAAQWRARPAHQHMAAGRLLVHRVDGYPQP